VTVSRKICIKHALSWTIITSFTAALICERHYGIVYNYSMSPHTRLNWLRRIILLKFLMCLFVWGLPALLGPSWLFEFFGLPFPDPPTYLRFFGAVVTAMSLLYWYAYRDPQRNVAILKFGILDNSLSTLVVIALALSGQILAPVLWLSAILTAFFALSFIYLMPTEP
jgi:hypothetical protein